jgi:hypothetical protein
MISGSTYKNAKMLYIDAIASWDQQTDLGGAVYVRLHIFIMCDILRYSRAKVAENRLSNTFGHFKTVKGVDCIAVDLLTR